jgi:hypothetical protein
MSMTQIIQKDITGDGKHEILIQGNACDNIRDTSYRYHDRSVWLMVLDRNLNFLFYPKEFKGAYSHIWPFVFEIPDQPNQAGYYVRSTLLPDKSKLCLFSKSGKVLKEKDLPGIPVNGIRHAFTLINNGKSLLALTENDKKSLIVVDQNLVNVAQIGVMANEFFSFFDLDGDGQQEIIALSPEHSKLEIMRCNLENPVCIELQMSSGYEPVLSIKENGNDMPQLVIWDHTSVTFLTYTKNPMFYLQWGIYLGVYLSILLFAVIIRRIQRYQIERKIQIEKKITELQMKIVKNQLDPHFTLNAVNSIIYAVNNNEPERAIEHLYHFSNLYRHLLLTADQYKCSLKDEIAFTTEYLKMEQLRFRDKYRFTIVINDDVNKDVEVPKMCIQTSVENAIKHGIAPKTSGGEITISVTIRQNFLEIEVNDNGIGRVAAEKLQNPSTHIGILLTRQYFELFTKLTNRKAQLEVFDLIDQYKNPSGTKVYITIQIN